MGNNRRPSQHAFHCNRREPILEDQRGKNRRTIKVPCKKQSMTSKDGDWATRSIINSRNWPENSPRDRHFASGSVVNSHHGAGPCVGCIALPAPEPPAVNCANRQRLVRPAMGLCGVLRIDSGILHLHKRRLSRLGVLILSIRQVMEGESETGEEVSARW